MFIFNWIFGIISAIFGFIIYILSAFGLHTMAKRNGIKHGWLVWIPIFQWYILGELIGNKLFGIDHIGWVLVLAPIVTGFVGFFTTGIVYSILLLLSYVLEVAAYYKLFKIYDPEHALLFTITGFLISPLLGLYLFLIRNNTRQPVPSF